MRRALVHGDEYPITIIKAVVSTYTAMLPSHLFLYFKAQAHFAPHEG